MEQFRRYRQGWMEHGHSALKFAKDQRFNWLWTRGKRRYPAHIKGCPFSCLKGAAFFNICPRSRTECAFPAPARNRFKRNTPSGWSSAPFSFYLFGSSLFGMGKDKIIVGLTWSLCGHDYEAKPLINKENWLSHNRLSCPPLHVKPPKLLLLPT